jgi:hypothetical protein
MGSHRQQWRHGVLQAGMPEGGGEVVLGASTGRCGAVGAPGWGQEALQQRGDGEAERAVELELAGAAGTGARMREDQIGPVDELQRVAVVL